MSDDDKNGGRYFSFVSKAYPPIPTAPFYVVEFSGTEAINAPYEFTLTLGSTKGDIDLEKVMAARAGFTMKFGSDLRVFRGEVVEADLVHFENNLFYYQFTFVSRLWSLGLTTLNEVYLGKTVPEIIEAILKAAGFSDSDYAMELESTYPAMDFQFQYQESWLDFIHRLIEREGIYYYHRHGESSETLVFTDKKTTHASIADPVYYRSDSDASVDVDFPALASLVSKTRRIPKNYAARDFDYGAATVSMEASASIDAEQSGEMLRTGDMLTGPKEKDVTKTPSNSERAKTLVDRWKEMMLCHRTLFHGEGTAHTIQPGLRVTLKGHFHDVMNKTYLPLSVSHKGSQTGVGFVDGRHALWRGSEKPFYRSNVLMIDADTQFRPERNTSKPVIAGTIPAFIDGSGDGTTAEVDSVGRYKVKFPYAKKTDRDPMKSSCWLRLATPYAGNNHGMHFPLHKGAEVAVAFFEGDPDRPYIAAALPDSVNPSVVTSANPAEARLMTGGQNLLSFMDTDTRQRILLQSPTGASWMRVGSTHGDPHSHDPVMAEEHKPGDGVALDTEKDYRLFVKENQYETTEGKRTTETVGANSETYKGGSTETYESCDLNQNIEHGRQNIDVTGNTALEDRLKTFRDNVKTSRDALQSAAGGFKGFAVATAITGTLAAVAVLAAPFAAVASAGLIGGMIIGGFYLGMATAVSVVGGAVSAASYRSKREDHIKKVKAEISSLRTALKSAKGVYELKTPVRDVEVEALDHLEVGTATKPGQQVTKIEGSQFIEISQDLIKAVEGDVHEEIGGDRVVSVAGWEMGIGETSRRAHAAGSIDLFLGEGKMEVLLLGGELIVKIAEGSVNLGPLAGFEVKARGAVFEYEELMAGLKLELKGAHVKEKEVEIEHGTVTLKDHDAHVHGGEAHVDARAAQIHI